MCCAVACNFRTVCCIYYAWIFQSICCALATCANCVSGYSVLLFNLLGIFKWKIDLDIGLIPYWTRQTCDLICSNHSFICAYLYPRKRGKIRSKACDIGGCSKESTTVKEEMLIHPRFSVSEWNISFCSSQHCFLLQSFRKWKLTDL